MKKYMIIGYKPLINYYFKEILNDSKLVVIDFLENYTEYDSGYKMEDEIITNKNYKSYNVKLSSSEFKRILNEEKPDYILFGVYEGFYPFDIYDFILTLNRYNQYKRFKFISLVSDYIYESVNKKIVTEKDINNHYKTVKGLFVNNYINLIKLFNFDYTVFIKSNLLGYYTFNSLLCKKIKNICNGLQDIPFPTNNEKEIYTLSFIHMNDLVKICLDFFKRENNEIINLCNSDTITIFEIEEIICNYFDLNNYSNTSHKKYLSNKKLNKIINYKNYISTKDGIKDTLNYYVKAYKIDKLTTKVKKEIDNLSKEELIDLVKKYNQNSLLNKDVINYIIKKLKKYDK